MVPSPLPEPLRPKTWSSASPSSTPPRTSCQPPNPRREKSAVSRPWSRCCCGPRCQAVAVPGRRAAPRRAELARCRRGRRCAARPRGACGQGGARLADFLGKDEARRARGARARGAVSGHDHDPREAAQRPAAVLRPRNSVRRAAPRRDATRRAAPARARPPCPRTGRSPGTCRARRSRGSPPPAGCDSLPSPCKAASAR